MAHPQPRNRTADVFCPCLEFEGPDLDGALESGCLTVGAVFRHLGALPRCGDCVAYVRDRVRAAVPARASARLTSPVKGADDMKNRMAKAKIAILTEEGCKLEFEAMLEDQGDLNALRDEAVRRFQATLAGLRTDGGSLTPDRIKIEVG